MFGPDGGALAGDGLETGLDGLDRTSGMAGHALQEEQTGLLVQNGVRRSGINLIVQFRNPTYLSLSLWYDYLKFRICVKSVQNEKMIKSRLLRINFSGICTMKIFSRNSIRLLINLSLMQVL